MTFSWQMAEELAAEHMRTIGFPDARRTPAGTDGGIDVVAATAVAQVKYQAAPVGAPVVQQLRGAAHGMDHALFYSSGGFTQAARKAAAASDVALFSFTTDNEVLPENARAAALVGELSWLPRYRALKARGLEATLQMSAAARAMGAVSDAVGTYTGSIRAKLVAEEPLTEQEEALFQALHEVQRVSVPYLAAMTTAQTSSRRMTALADDMSLGLLERGLSEPPELDAFEETLLETEAAVTEFSTALADFDGPFGDEYRDQFATATRRILAERAQADADAEALEV